MESIEETKFRLLNGLESRAPYWRQQVTLGLEDDSEAFINSLLNYPV